MEDYYDINDVYLSLPTKIDRGGIEHTIRLQLDDTEVEGLRHSAKILKDTIEHLEL
jgi:L-lactate dehydrogenase